MVSGTVHPHGLTRRGVPRLPHHAIDRPRIYAILDRWAPITFVAGPVGSGKRTVVAGWLRHQTRDVAVHWLSDEEALITAPTSDALLVLDMADEVIEAHIDRLIEQLKFDDTLFVVVISRRELSAQLRAQQAVEVATVTMADLRLDADEVVELFTRRGTVIERTVARQLNRELGGWPLLVHRTALMVDPGVRGAGDIDAARAAVQRHLAEELLPTLASPEALDHLAQLAVVEHLTPHTAQVALGVDAAAAEAIVEELAGTGLLKASTGLRDRNYFMVPEIRRVLRPQAHQPEVVHRAIIAFHTKRAEWNEALEQAMALGDPMDIAELVEKSWADISLSRRPLLEEAMSRLPRQFIEKRPEMRMVQIALNGLALPETGHFEALPHDEAQLQDMGTSAQAAEHITRYLTTAGAARYAGRFHESLTLLRKLHIIADAALDHAGEKVPLLGPMVYIHEALTLQLLGRFAEAVPLFHTAMRRDRFDDNRVTTRDAEGSLAMHYAIRGDLPEARRWARQEAARKRLPGWFERRVAVAGNVARAWLAIESGDRAEARGVLLDLVRQREDDELWPFILHAQTAHELLWGDVRAMLADLREFAATRRAVSPPGSIAEVIVVALEVDLRMALGHGAAAAGLLANAPHHSAVDLRRARLALLRGNFAEVLDYDLGVREHSPRFRAEMGLMRAAALRELGRAEAARTLDEQVAHLMHAYGLRSPWAALPAALRPAELALHPSDPALRPGDPAPRPGDPALELGGLDVPAVFPDSLEVVELTPSEDVVLDGLAAGFSAEEIAEQAYLSVNTIKTHTRTLYRKLGVSSRLEALARARALGLRD